MYPVREGLKCKNLRSRTVNRDSSDKGCVGIRESRDNYTAGRQERLEQRRAETLTHGNLTGRPRQRKKLS